MGNPVTGGLPPGWSFEPPKAQSTGGLPAGWSFDAPVNQTTMGPMNVNPYAANVREADASEQGSGSVFAGLTDVAKGFGKSLLGTAYGGGDLIRQGLGMERVINTPEAQAAMAINNPTQEFGAMAEKVAEFVPAGAAVVKGAIKIPTLAKNALGLNKTRAAGNLAEVLQAAKNQAIDLNDTATTGLRAMELEKVGNYVPQVVKNLMERATGPGQMKMLYPEARDFASTISRFSADEAGKMAPQMYREVGAIKEALNRAITQGAGAVGKADQYARGMKEYARANRFGEFVDDVKPSAAQLVKALGLTGLGGATLTKFLGAW